jgi:hypothetical protein
MPFFTFFLGLFLGIIASFAHVTTPQVLSAEALCAPNGGLRYVTVTVFSEDRINCVNGAQFDLGDKK